MVRAGAESKREKKKLPNKVTRNLKSSKILPSVNKSARITRSKSSLTETVQKVTKDPIRNCSTRNTRSNSKANILPINTRSKSKKIEIITTNTDSNEQQVKNLDNTSQTETKSLSLSKVQFVKLHDFKVNSIVLAKQKYSVPWPSKVLKIEKERVFVYFFGDKRSGYVPKIEIYDFILSVSAVRSVIASKKKQQSYATGIGEVEVLMGITSENSLLNGKK